MRDHTVTRAGAPGATSSLDDDHQRVVFEAFARTLALGVVFHAWQLAQPPLSAGPIVAATAALVLLRVTPLRFIALLAAIALDFFGALPEPWNHLILIGFISIATLLWWGVRRIVDPASASDPVVLLRELAPFLRVGFLLTWFFAALAKYNRAFFDGADNCTVWILHEMPLMRVPSGFAAPAAIAAAALETAIPLLLVFRVTRHAGVILGLLFHAGTAYGGHAAFAGLAWAFYLLFLPAATVATGMNRLSALADRHVPRVMGALARPRSVVWAFGVAVAWMLAVGLVGLLPFHERWLLRRWGAAVPCLLWLGAWGWALARDRALWRPSPQRHAFRVRNGLFLAALAAIVVLGASPYLGLRSYGTLTMYSDLRTEAGYWNHLLVPESVRVFGWQDTVITGLSSDDPDLDARFAALPSRATVRNHVLALVADHPTATVRFTVAGENRVAAPVAADPLLGAERTGLERWLGAYRPLPGGGACLH